MLQTILGDYFLPGATSLDQQLLARLRVSSSSCAVVLEASSEDWNGTQRYLLVQLGAVLALTHRSTWIALGVYKLRLIYPSSH